MTAPGPARSALRTGAAILLTSLALLSPAPGQGVRRPGPAERMYREGILPSGQPMRTQGPDGRPVQGTTFTCAGCHLRAGLGNADERPPVPPINGARLFSPSFRTFPFLTGAERAELPAAARDPLRRPAYTRATLVVAIRDGVDPAGHTLDPVMPRYLLDDRDAELLAHYLEGLSATPAPGVTGTTLHFATVVDTGAPAADREAMLATMRQQVALHNQVYARSLVKANRITAMKEMTLPLRRWELAVWELQGPPSGWRAQLEAHERAGPVFALVGGISDGDWQPVQAFCQDRGLPCILPLTDFPGLPGPDACTLYLTGGYEQEGGTAGDRAADLLQDGSPGPVIQVVPDTPAGRALARGFREALARRGAPPAREVPAPPGALPGAFLAHLLAGSAGKGILALWGGPEACAALAGADGPERPALAFMSASLLGPAVWDLPQGARDRTLLTWPYRLPPGGDASRVRSRTRLLMQVVDEGVRRMARDFYRDNFLDRIGLMDDRSDTDYPLLSFAPGRPWLASCRLVRVAPGPARAFLDSQSSR